jgi:hypothetical protein
MNNVGLEYRPLMILQVVVNFVFMLPSAGINVAGMKLTSHQPVKPLQY